jgi:DNA-binding transcriptional ArsR family regulator
VTTYQERQFDALGDATRRAILDRLVDGPASVGTLSSSFPISRPAISQHLRILKDAQLVADTSQGTRRLYRLNPEGFESVRVCLDRFWGNALEAFKTKVEGKKTR